jgi:hypothetical protein
MLAQVGCRKVGFTYCDSRRQMKRVQRSQEDRRIRSETIVNDLVELLFQRFGLMDDDYPEINVPLELADERGRHTRGYPSVELSAVENDVSLKNSNLGDVYATIGVCQSFVES